MTQSPQPIQAIQDAFKKLNPEYVVHQSTMNEILYIGNKEDIGDKDLASRSEQVLMPTLKHPSSWTECSLNAALKQIKTLRSATEKNRDDTFKVLHSTTIAALVLSGVDARDIERMAALDLRLMDKAAITIKIWKQQYPELISKRSGQPQKKRFFHITMILAEEYYRATGKYPVVATDAHDPGKLGHRAYGDFLALVKAVFFVLAGEKKASPEAMARAVEDLWKRRAKQQKLKIKRRSKKKKSLIKMNKPYKSISSNAH